MSNFEIEINNLTKIEINQKNLKRIAIEVLKKEKNRNKNFSIAFIGANRMRKLNKEYRNKNRVTDILAFPENEIEFGKSYPKRLKKTRNLGEIVICLREIKKNSKRLKISFKEELNRVLIHGILHLLGYDHEKEIKEVLKMKMKEEKYLNICRKIKFDPKI